MIRKQVYLQRYQDMRLKRLAHGLGVSEAELIRQSLDRGLRIGTVSDRQPEAWADIKAFIRKRMRKGPLAGKRTWRREAIYDAR